jgi:hypothetical protein
MSKSHDDTPKLLKTAPSKSENLLTLHLLSEEPLRHGSHVALRHKQSKLYLCNQLGCTMPKRVISWDRRTPGVCERFELVHPNNEFNANDSDELEEANGEYREETGVHTEERLLFGSKVVLRSLAKASDSEAYLSTNDYQASLEISNRRSMWTIRDGSGATHPWSRMQAV